MIIPARDAAARVGMALRDWGEHFRRAAREYQLIVVDDGSRDDTAVVVQRLREKDSNVQFLQHDTGCGLGACLRTAMPNATLPFVATLTLDYGYKPADLDAMFNRLKQKVDVYGTMKPVDAVNGWRTGHPVPGFWKGVGFAYRYGVRIALGFKPEPLAGWLGLRNHWRSWWLWAAMGVPLFDVTSGLKLFRRELFDRIPIQSDGDFALAEIAAKLTFLGAMVAEEPLAMRSDAIPVTEFAEFRKVFRDARFSGSAPASASVSAACPPA